MTFCTTADNESNTGSRVRVSCTAREMKVIVSINNQSERVNPVTSEKDAALVYLEKLKDYPSCQAKYDASSETYSFFLPLDDDSFFTCGTSRLKNKITGTKVFYHKVVIEQRIRDGSSPYSTSSSPSSSSFSSSSSHPSAAASGTSSSPSDSGSRVKHLDQLHNGVRDRSSSTFHAADGSSSSSGSGATDREDESRSASSGEEEDNWSQESVTIRCIVPGDTSLHPRLRRRQVIEEPDLPANFSESSEELIDFSGSVTGRAPMPLLNIAVKQNGEFVDTALNVSPGTPLEMVIYLDEVSSRVYGLLTTFLRVTDNTPRKQEEIIILNGCSIDPYIFANFETEDQGKSLSAKFRAFKFPESNYVLFVGTVNVCLKSCQGTQCGEGQIGYGRKRRSYDPLPFDPNKVFEAELTAFVRVGESDQHKSSLSSSSSDPAILSPDDVAASSKVSRDLTSHPLKWTSTQSDATTSSSSKNSSITPHKDLFPVLIFILMTISTITAISSRRSM